MFKLLNFQPLNLSSEVEADDQFSFGHFNIATQPVRFSKYVEFEE